MSSINTSSILPIDIINKILSMSSVQQDKMYSPSFSVQNGRLNWRFNPLNSKIQKIASLYVSPQNRVKFEAVKIGDTIYECKTMMFINVEGNYVEYMDIINHITPRKHIYLYLKYTRFDEHDFNMFFTGMIYDINRYGNRENINELTKKNIIYLSYLNEDGLKCFDIPNPNIGSWHYNQQLHIMEFIIDYSGIDDLSDNDDDDDDIMTETEYQPEWASLPIEPTHFEWEDIQPLDMYM